MHKLFSFIFICNFCESSHKNCYRKNYGNKSQNPKPDTARFFSNLLNIFMVNILC